MLRLSRADFPQGPQTTLSFSRSPQAQPWAALVLDLTRQENWAEFGISLQPRSGAVRVKVSGQALGRTLRAGQSWEGQTPAGTVCLTVLSLQAERADFAEPGRPPADVGGRAALLLRRADPHAPGCSAL